MVRAGSRPPTSSTAAVISGLSVTWARSEVSTPGGKAKLRERFWSGSTTWTSSNFRPKRWAIRSPCSNNKRATPEPIVPYPIMATFAVSMVPKIPSISASLALESSMVGDLAVGRQGDTPFGAACRTSANQHTYFHREKTICNIQIPRFIKAPSWNLTPSISSKPCSKPPAPRVTKARCSKSFVTMWPASPTRFAPTCMET